MSQIGFEMQNVALSWFMYQLTGSALSLGLMGLARVLPVFVFALIAGHVSDTRPRRGAAATSEIRPEQGAAAPGAFFKGVDTTDPLSGLCSCAARTKQAMPQQEHYTTLARRLGD